MSLSRPCLALAAALSVLVASAGVAASPCDDAIRQVEREVRLPPGLLRAIALVESGRRTDAGYAPWPWTVNSAEGGAYLDDRAAVLRRIEDLRGKGLTNIDVGCMQINLLHHPDAFASLDEAVDPLANVRYAARFLTALQRETGSWERAIGRYHSATPDLAAGYRARVAARWDPDPPRVEPQPAPLVAAARPPTRPVVAQTRRIVLAAAAAPRASEANPVRAAPGAIGVVFARAAEPIVYGPSQARDDDRAPGSVRAR